MKRLSTAELDLRACRLEKLEQECEDIKDELKEQVMEFGSTPPRAEKSKRIATDRYQLTLSTSTSTEIKDGEVERIRIACDDGLFAQLFTEVKKYKLCASAMKLLAGPLPRGAPSNLRRLFAAAVVTKEGAPRLRIEKIEQEASA